MHSFSSFAMNKNTKYCNTPKDKSKQSVSAWLNGFFRAYQKNSEMVLYKKIQISNLSEDKQRIGSSSFVILAVNLL